MLRLDGLLWKLCLQGPTTATQTDLVRVAVYSVRIRFNYHVPLAIISIGHKWSLSTAGRPCNIKLGLEET